MKYTLIIFLLAPLLAYGQSQNEDLTISKEEYLAMKKLIAEYERQHPEIKDTLSSIYSKNNEVVAVFKQYLVVVQQGIASGDFIPKDLNYIYKIQNAIPESAKMDLENLIKDIVADFKRKVENSLK